MNKIFNILAAKCPKCGKTNMFTHSMYNVLKFEKMNSSCDNCKLNFHPEPGYYLGAMYVSYFLSSFLLLITALILMVFAHWEIEPTLIVLLTITIFTIPIMLRISRALWLYVDKV